MLTVIDADVYGRRECYPWGEAGGYKERSCPVFVFHLHVHDIAYFIVFPYIYFLLLGFVLVIVIILILFFVVLLFSFSSFSSLFSYPSSSFSSFYSSLSSSVSSLSIYLIRISNFENRLQSTVLTILERHERGRKSTYREGQ